MGYAALFHRNGLWVFDTEAAANAFAAREGDFEEFGGVINAAQHCRGAGADGIKFTREDQSFPQILAAIMA